MTNDVEGIMVPPRDEDKLAEALIKMMTDREMREEMGNKGRPTALKYDWTTIAQRVFNFYEKTLERIGAKKPAPEVKSTPMVATSGKT